MRKSTKTLDRLTALRADLCWNLDTFAPAIGALVHQESDQLETAGVDKRGRVYWNPDFVATLNDAELRFVLLHEALHPMLQHQNRRGDRDHKLWNCAADLSINSMLSAIKPGYITMPKIGLHPKTHAPGAPDFASAEEYYAWLMQHADSKAACEGAQGDGEPMPGAGCGVMDDDKDGKGDGDGEGKDGDKDGDGAGGRTLSPSEWRMIAHVVQEEARRHSAGNVALGALVNLLDIPAPRVRWGDLLRRAATQTAIEAGRDDISWSRRSRRSNAVYTLPGQVTTRARIAVVIDSSGSVDDKSLARAVSETAAAVDASGVPAYLVIHDAAVHFEGWIRPGTRGRQVADFVRGRGGTWFGPAYAKVAEQRCRFGSLVHFTDGVPGDRWPDLPSNCKHGLVALVGYADESYIPKTGYRAVACDL